MNNRREVVSGLLAALTSLIIIGGGIAISFVENNPEEAQPIANQFSPTFTNSATIEVITPSPVKPTLTPTKIPATMTPTSPTETPTCNYPSDWLPVTIEEGDSIESLVNLFHTSPEIIMEANCLLSSEINPGSIVYVPEPESTLTPTRIPSIQPTETKCSSPPAGWVMYTVRYGDTLYSLDTTFGLSVSELQTANCMGNNTQIQAGETIWVPFLPTQTNTPTKTPQPQKTDPPTPTPWVRRTRRPTRTPRFSW